MRAALFAVSRDRSGPAPALIGTEPVAFLIADAYGMGGTIRTTFNMAAWLARRHPVEIVSAIRARDTTFFPLPDGVRLTQLDDRRKGHQPDGLKGWVRAVLSAMPSPFADPADGAYPTWTLWTDLMVVLWLRSVRDGVLITTRPRFNVLAGRGVDRRVVVIGQEHLHAAAYPPNVRAVIEREYPHLDVLTVLTEQDKADYEGILSGGRVRVTRIPNGAQRAGRNLALEERGTTIVAAGRLTKVKGFDLLIEAWSRVEASWPDWTVDVYGRGPEREALQALITERGLNGRVRLMGPTPDLRARLEAAGMFVLPSRLEGFPLVLIEAMAAACPVISFDCPRGPGEIVHDRVNGMLVAPEDVTGLAAAIQESLASPELRRTLSLAAAATSRCYSVEAVGARWDALLGPSTEDLHLSSRGGID